MKYIIAYVVNNNLYIYKEEIGGLWNQDYEQATKFNSYMEAFKHITERFHEEGFTDKVEFLITFRNPIDATHFG